MSSKVRDVMTGNVETISPDADLQAAAGRMKDLDIGPLPVCDANQKLVGILTDRDITVRATAEGRDPYTTRVQDVMSPEVYFVDADADVEEAARLMSQHQVRRLCVLDSDRKLVGIVSLGDLALSGADDATTEQTLEAVSEPSEASRQ
jgi:CBS domain-containing protein